MPSLDTVVDAGVPAAVDICVSLLRKQYPDGMQVLDLMDATVSCMRELRNRRDLRGAQKKRIIVRALTVLCKEMCPDDMPRVEQMLQDVLPQTMDYLIEVEKGKLRLRKSLRRLGCCC